MITQATEATVDIKVLSRWSNAFPGTDVWVKIIAGLIILTIWQVGVGAFAPRFVAKPLNIIGVFPAVITDPAFLAAVASTLGAVLEGLFIAVVAGVIVGIAMGRVKIIDRMLNFYINGFYAMPMVAVLPLLAIWFGYESNARLATIVFAAFFSVAMNARDGARSVPTEYLDVAKSFRAKRRYVWFDITLHASLPYLIAGIRLASGRALVGAVIAEFFVSLEGVGMYILSHARSFKHNEAVVGVLALVAFGLLVDWTMNWLMRRYLPWARQS
jgi:ABC-type nitrate/sulfonate/bicarbonate transport system permease component